MNLSWKVLSLCSVMTVTATLQGAGPVPVVDPLKSPGWQAFYNNDYDAAVSYFAEEKKLHPGDPGAFNHYAQSLLYRELFRNGALESELVTGNNPFLRSPKVNVSDVDRASFNGAVDQAQRLAQARLDKNGNDATALYDLSVSCGLRANFDFLVDKAWTDALRSATDSRKYSNQLLAVEPNMTDAYLIQGLHDYVVGSLPFYVRMVGFLAGFHGDRERGLQELQMVAQKGVVNKYDAQILLAVIYRRERRPKEAIPLLQNLAKEFPHNYLLQLEQVEMYSDAGNKQAALAVLATVEQLKAEGTPGYTALPSEKIRYLRGNLLFWYGDLGPAITEMKAVTSRTDRLDLNTELLAWLRLGQLYDLRGEHGNAIFAYKHTVQVAPDSAVASEAKGYIAAPYKRKQAAVQIAANG